METTRLQNRIVGFALAAILITGLAVGLATAIPAFRYAKSAVESAVDYNVRLQALALDQFTTRLADMALQVTSRTVIRNKLDDYVHGRTSLEELRRFSAPKLADALALHPEAIAVVRLDLDGQVLVSVGALPPDVDWPLPEGTTPVIGAPVHHGGESYLIAAAAIHGRNGERIGTDAVLFRDRQFHRILGDLDHLLPGSSIYLAVPGERFFKHGEGSLVPAEPPAVLRGLVREGRHQLLRTADDLLFVAPMTGDWLLAVSLPDHVVYAPAVEELMLPALTVLLMLLAASLGTNRLLRPLAERAIRLARRLQSTGAEQRALLEYAHSFMFRITEGRLGFVSPNVTKVLGYRPDGLPADLAERLADAGRDTGDEGEVPAYRLRTSRAGGQPVVLEINAHRTRNAEGRAQVLGVARDVTARVDAEEALRASEERLRTLIDAGPDFICFKDGQGRCLEVNRAGRELLGLDESVYVGRRSSEVAECVDGAMRDVVLHFAERDAQAWETRQPLRSEETVPGVNGERVLDMIRVPLFDADGERSGLLVLGRDVTERVQAERELARSTAEWNHAMDFLEDAVFLVDMERRVVRANRAACRFVESTSEEVIGKALSDLLHPRGMPQPCRVCEALVERRDAFITLELEHHDNSFGRPVEVMVKIVSDADGNPVRCLVGIHDLTRTRDTEEELRLAATVFEGSHEGVVITDAERRVLRVNAAFTHITGVTTEEAVGHTVQEILSVDMPEDARHQYIWETVADQGKWQGEVWYRRKNGEMFPAWHRISALLDHRGQVLHYINLFTDVTEKKLSEERIHHLAHYDVLTDLPNRLLFNDRLAHSMERAQRNGGKVVVLFLDLDHFKNVNDTLGHQFGDELLQLVAERLRAAVREQDTVARLGGDEFTVILEELTHVQDAGLVANKILAAIGHPINLQGHELFVGASIGISVFPDDGRDVQMLLRNADAAMYRAKEHGRNTYQYYTPELTLASIERLDLENALRRALERGELFLHYQPQVAIPSGRIIGAEALLRWNHPTKGLIPPSVFVPLAEDAGLMGIIGSWVIESACLQLRAWRAEGVPLRRMAVNLSGQQIIRGGLVETVSEVLERTGVDPADLELEITETFVMAHLNDGLETLHALKRLGITLAIDDFGTGYSSLSYLKRLPIDRLKIDRSFVKDIPADRDDMAIAATIIAMAHNLDLQVIAEGVEQSAQVDFLRRHRCDEVQGYLFSKPVSAAAFGKLFKKKHTA
jgi:diguanylate cyclase (GGDEF)-like protein/PAS domain S-box-containing protein